MMAKKAATKAPTTKKPGAAEGLQAAIRTLATLRAQVEGLTGLVNDYKEYADRLESRIKTLEAAPPTVATPASADPPPPPAQVIPVVGNK